MLLLQRARALKELKTEIAGIGITSTGDGTWIIDQAGNSVRNKWGVTGPSGQSNCNLARNASWCLTSPLANGDRREKIQKNRLPPHGSISLAKPS